MDWRGVQWIGGGAEDSAPGAAWGGVGFNGLEGCCWGRGLGIWGHLGEVVGCQAPKGGLSVVKGRGELDMGGNWGPASQQPQTARNKEGLQERHPPVPPILPPQTPHLRSRTRCLRRSSSRGGSPSSASDTGNGSSRPTPLRTFFDAGSFGLEVDWLVD